MLSGKISHDFVEDEKYIFAEHIEDEYPVKVIFSTFDDTFEVDGALEDIRLFLIDYYGDITMAISLHPTLFINYRLS